MRRDRRAQIGENDFHERNRLHAQWIEVLLDEPRRFHSGKKARVQARAKAGARQITAPTRPANSEKMQPPAL
jgi:hypothetical protein